MVSAARLVKLSNTRIQWQLNAPSFFLGLAMYLCVVVAPVRHGDICNRMCFLGHTHTMGFYDTGPSTIIIKKEGLGTRLCLAGIKVGGPQSNYQLPILKSANKMVICVSILILHS